MLIYKCSVCGNRLYWDGIEGLVCPKCGLVTKESMFSGKMPVV